MEEDPQLKPSSNGANELAVATHDDNTTTNSTKTTSFEAPAPAAPTTAARRSHGYKSRSSSSFSYRPSTTTSNSALQLAAHILRATALILAFIAAIVMGTAKDAARVSIADPITLKTSTFVETVRPKYSSSLVYFIVINVLAFLYSASSLAVSFIHKEASKNIELAFVIADLLFLTLLFSSNSAAIATSIAIEHGNVNLGWVKICGAVSSFCTQVTAAIILSMFASVAHFAIVILWIIGIRNRF